MKNIAKEWNMFDTLLFKIDSMIDKVKKIRADEKIDYEEIIEAETKYLKTENELLKSLQYPKQIIKSNKNYICPNKNCEIEISSVLVEKYKIKFCPECGQRIYYNPSTTCHRASVTENS